MPAVIDFVSKFERVVTTVLVGMMALVVALATIELGWVLVQDIMSPPAVILEVHELLDVFGVFLLVLIGIELLETLKGFVREREIRAEIIILVALIEHAARSSAAMPF
jgi:uncharacterized membrane protein (DUF373 family)